MPVYWRNQGKLENFNGMKKTAYWNLRYAAKTVLRGKFSFKYLYLKRYLNSMKIDAKVLHTISKLNPATNKKVYTQGPDRIYPGAASLISHPKSCIPY